VGDAGVHPAAGDPNEGRQLRRTDVVVDEIGRSLAFATATITRQNRAAVAGVAQ
jgi:hypothetical protein